MKSWILVVQYYGHTFQAVEIDLWERLDTYSRTSAEHIYMCVFY